MNWKGFGTKRSWPNFKVLSRHSRGETEENQGNLNQDSRSPGPRIDPGTPEYENKSVNHSTTTFGKPVVKIDFISPTFKRISHKDN
jgi:hypothetical protein